MPSKCDYMVHINITRAELENLYTHNGLTRKELRHLLKITPNRIPEKLSEVFRYKLNPFKHSNLKDISFRGFVHAAPKKLLEMYNKLHYELTAELGGYKLYLISSSPNMLETSIPIIVPFDTATPHELGKAHFANITASLHEITEFKPNLENGQFLITKEITLLGFPELFSVTDPLIKLTDLADMLQNRYNTTNLLNKGVTYWFMSSPVYEGRAGGNSFSPISPFDPDYRCDPNQLELLQKDLMCVPLPYFTNGKGPTTTFEYNCTIKAKLKFFNSKHLNYRYEPNLDTVDAFLRTRTPSKKETNAELNISTNSLVLDSLRTKPLESFITNPLLPAKILTHTDMPILFTADDFVLDPTETELMDYSMDINQLIYHANLSYPNSPYDHLATADAVRGVMSELRRSFFELHELMIEGIIFNPGHIGGLGEHLTRIANSILRGNNYTNEHDALDKAEGLFSEMINKLLDEFSSDIKSFYYMFEEKRSERDQIKVHRLRTQVNSILYDLNNSYKDGWSYEMFEAELKKRVGIGSAKVKDVFEKLIGQKEVTELTPGLYWRIMGFDRYY